MNFHVGRCNNSNEAHSRVRSSSPPPFVARADYSHRCYAWESVILGRKLFLTLAYVFLSPIDTALEVSFQAVARVSMRCGGLCDQVWPDCGCRVKTHYSRHIAPLVRSSGYSSSCRAVAM